MVGWSRLKTLAACDAALKKNELSQEEAEQLASYEQDRERAEATATAARRKKARKPAANASDSAKASYMAKIQPIDASLKRELAKLKKVYDALMTRQNACSGIRARRTELGGGSSSSSSDGSEEDGTGSGSEEDREETSDEARSDDDDGERGRVPAKGTKGQRGRAVGKTAGGKGKADRQRPNSGRQQQAVEADGLAALGRSGRAAAVFGGTPRFSSHLQYRPSLSPATRAPAGGLGPSLMPATPAPAAGLGPFARMLQKDASMAEAAQHLPSVKEALKTAGAKNMGRNQQTFNTSAARFYRETFAHGQELQSAAASAVGQAATDLHAGAAQAFQLAAEAQFEQQRINQAANIMGWKPVVAILVAGDANLVRTMWDRVALDSQLQSASGGCNKSRKKHRRSPSVSSGSSGDSGEEDSGSSDDGGRHSSKRSKRRSSKRSKHSSKDSNKHVREHDSSRDGRRSDDGSLDRSRCYKCGSSQHRVYECTDFKGLSDGDRRAAAEKARKSHLRR